MNRKLARDKAQALVAKMTVEEAASQLRYDAPAIAHLGIPAYNWWNEALHGVARAGTATSFPQAIGLAAMFDPQLIEALEKCGGSRALAAEALGVLAAVARFAQDARPEPVPARRVVIKTHSKIKSPRPISLRWERSGAGFHSTGRSQYSRRSRAGTCDSRPACSLLRLRGSW